MDPENNNLPEEERPASEPESAEPEAPAAEPLLLARVPEPALLEAASEPALLEAAPEPGPVAEEPVAVEPPEPEPVVAEVAPPAPTGPPALLVKFLPTGPWRIAPDTGDRDRVGRIYHSDAVYAALASAMARLGMREEWLAATARRGTESAVRFSSCFPFLRDTLFIVPPRNLWPPPPSAKVRWKGARFVPVSLVESMLAEQPLEEDRWVVDGLSECLLAAPASQSAPTPVGPFRAAVRSNAALDRQGAGIAAHSAGCLEFAAGAGLWLAAVFADGDAEARWKEPVQAALRLLADSGFGGERSRGWGRSEMPEFTEGRFPWLLLKPAPPAAGSVYWMLSLFSPSDAEPIDWDKGNYSLVTRAGRIESPAGWGEPKKVTRMVAEGSVLFAAEPPRGVARDVAPDGFPHPVYRAGFAVSIPIPRRQTV